MLTHDFFLNVWTQISHNSLKTGLLKSKRPDQIRTEQKLPDQTRIDKTRQDKTRQGKTRQDGRRGRKKGQIIRGKRTGSAWSGGHSWRLPGVYGRGSRRVTSGSLSRRGRTAFTADAATFVAYCGDKAESLCPLTCSSSKKTVLTRGAFGDVSVGEDAFVFPSTSGQIIRGKRTGTFCSTAVALKFFISVLYLFASTRSSDIQSEEPVRTLLCELNLW